VLRRTAVLLFLATALLTGCSIDTVEWESTGEIVEHATHALEEEHHVEHPKVECIQREVLGALWECRAEAGADHYHCEIHEGVRHRIKSIHCEREHAEGEIEHEEEAPSEHENEAPAEQEEEAPAEH
jgi:hypothetical protein